MKFSTKSEANAYATTLEAAYLSASALLQKYQKKLSSKKATNVSSFLNASSEAVEMLKELYHSAIKEVNNTESIEN